MPIGGPTSRDPYSDKRDRVSVFFSTKGKKVIDQLSNREIARMLQVDEGFIRKYRAEIGIGPSTYVTRRGKSIKKKARG